MHANAEVACRAGELVRKKYHCSEAVVLAVGERELGTISPEIIKITSAFGGGLAGTRQELCGALSAGAIVIGLLYGRSQLGQDETLSRYLIALYRERFLAEFGGTLCEPLRAQYVKPDGTGNCAALVERATRILLQVLEEGKTVQTQS